MMSLGMYLVWFLISSRLLIPRNPSIISEEHLIPYSTFWRWCVLDFALAIILIFFCRNKVQSRSFMVLDVVFPLRLGVQTSFWGKMIRVWGVSIWPSHFEKYEVPQLGHPTMKILNPQNICLSGSFTNSSPGSERASFAGIRLSVKITSTARLASASTNPMIKKLFAE